MILHDSILFVNTATSPHLKLMVVEDALGANGPHIKLLKSLNMRFILGVKPKGHEFLFDCVQNSNVNTYEEISSDGTRRVYHFINSVPLNDTNSDLQVNFLEYWEYPAKGNTKHFSWVTDIEISKENVKQIMQGARARWHIENETFNTLKNQGYEFEHNFGHGKQNLCSIFSMIMMLAFLIDQAQSISCKFFKKARKESASNSELWFNLRAVFKFFICDSWEQLYSIIIESSSSKKDIKLIYDTS